MGWLWSSGTGSAASLASQDSTSDAARPAVTSAPAPKRDDNDFYDPEIAKFLAQVQSEFGSKNSNKASTPTPTKVAESQSGQSSSAAATAAAAPTKSSSWNFWGGSSPKTTDQKPEAVLASAQSRDTTPAPPAGQQQDETPDRLDPISESLLPTTMSCRQAFDTAFHCNSLGGQWTSVYRAGSVRSCSEHWDNFWFCMRTRAYSGEMKEEAIRDYYRQRELAKYYGPDKPNSTDIWEPRTEKVEPGTAFKKQYVQPEISDEEWWQMEIEHRRKVQEELARKDATAGR